ncbi:MAG: hypothetical protein Q4G63_02470 [Bacteroidia bacterium]|nr:hypothetical protein [Bacteroidia bacterium]
MTKKHNIIIVILLLLAYSCEKEQITRYNQPPAINFGNLVNVPPRTAIEVNFAMLFDKEFNVQEHTIEPLVMLQGALMEKPINFVLKATNDSTYDGKPEPLAEMSFKNPYTFAPKEFKQNCKIIVKRPKEIDKAFKANLLFDYDKSDVIAGVQTHQVFKITVIDELTLKTVNLTPELWERYLKYSFGEYSGMKLRLIVHTLKTEKIGAFIPYQDILKIKESLNDYNKAHPDAPLKDEKGNLVVFP